MRREARPPVASIVDGVTKLGKVRFNSATEQQVENYRKMLLSMAQDARAAIRWELEDLAFKFLEPEAGTPTEVVGRRYEVPWTTDQSGSSRATLDGNGGGNSRRSNSGSVHCGPSGHANPAAIRPPG